MDDSLDDRPPIQIIPVYSSVAYQQATLQNYDRRGQESPSGYGALGIQRYFKVLLHCNYDLDINATYLFTSFVVKHN